MQKLFNLPKLHTTPVNVDEIFASFPDIHNDLALNNTVDGPLGTDLDELPELINVLYVAVSLASCIYTFCSKSFIQCSTCAEYIKEQKWVELSATLADRTSQRYEFDVFRKNSTPEIGKWKLYEKYGTPGNGSANLLAIKLVGWF